MAQEPRNDPAQIRFVRARLPQGDLAHAWFVLSADTSSVLRDSRRHAALGDYVGLIFGDGVLESPVAMFQGLKRPYLRDGLDNFVFVYVSNPKLTFSYAPRDRFAGTGPHPDLAPANRVFTVFVSMARDMIDMSTSGNRSADREVRGVILYWEWAPASPVDPRLPVDFQDRYRRSVWLPR